MAHNSPLALGSITIGDLLGTREALRREPLSQDSETRIGQINDFLANFPDGVVHPDQLLTPPEVILIVVC